MTEGQIPQVEDIDELTPQERAAVMIVREGNSDNAPIEQMIRKLFMWAVIHQSSDIHIDGHDDRGEMWVNVSVRTPKGLVNGRYRGANARHFEAKLFQLTATPQGGSTPDILSARFSLALPTTYAIKHGLAPKDHLPYAVDVRVQYTRLYDGFSFVCRLLDQQRTPALSDLGLSYALLRAIRKAVAEPSGLILVSGPTGSGKTTLLNAILGTLNNGTNSIVTIEDPVEFRLRGPGPIKQIQVHGDITFARALRATLRKDPDIILIGEIRDEETMEIALQAAQTGHLVLASIHANSAAETLSRALDLTLDKRRDAYRLAETVKLVMAQRLLDKYDGTPVPRSLHRDELSWLETNGMGFLQGISESDGQVKRGKAAIIEAIAMADGIKKIIRSEHLDVRKIHQVACDQWHYETLTAAGVRAVQGQGCRLKDCMTRLESNSEAEHFPGLRGKLARDTGLSLLQVGQAIDAFCQAQDEGSALTLEEALLPYLARGPAESIPSGFGNSLHSALDATALATVAA